MPYPPQKFSDLCNAMDRVVLNFRAEAEKVGFQPFSDFYLMMHCFVDCCYFAADRDGVDFTKRKPGMPDVINYTPHRLEQLQQCFEMVFPDLKIVHKEIQNDSTED